MSSNNSSARNQNNCPICVSNKIENYFDGFRCQNCNHIYASNVFNKNYWDNLYEHDYTTVDRKFDVQRNQMYNEELKWIKNFKNLTGNFLDVGCSYGTFLSFLPDVMNKVGIDVSSSVINEAKTLYPNFEFQKTFIEEFKSEKKFNFIQFRGVIQHSFDPVITLKSAIPYLEENGIIIITSLPDFSSFSSKIYKENFNFYLPKVSPHFFTQESFHYLLKSLNLKISKQQSPYLKTPYSNFPKDLFTFLFNKLQNKRNPAFFGNVKNYIITKNPD